MINYTARHNTETIVRVEYSFSAKNKKEAVEFCKNKFSIPISKIEIKKDRFTVAVKSTNDELIDFNSIDEAVACIKENEEEDKAAGWFEEDWYKIINNTFDN